MSKIEIKNIYKIFGPQPDQVLSMVQNGADKEQVLEETGHTVGLDNVSLSIEEGEIFVCMGLSGSGKSTLIRHINRLIDPTAGQVLVNDVDVLSLDEKEILEFRKKTMSMVFQRFGFSLTRQLLKMWLMDLKFKKCQKIRGRKSHKIK